MTCTAWESAIDAYIDDELDSVSTRRLEAHLAACDLCRALVDDLQGLRHEAQRLPASMVPPRDLWPGIERRLTSSPVSVARSDHGWRSWRNGLVLAAAAVVLIVLGTWAVSQRRLVAPAGEMSARQATEPTLSTTVSDAPDAPYASDAPLATEPGPAARDVVPVTNNHGSAGPAVAATREAASRLRTTVETRWAGLSPATRDVLERNLTVIDEAILEIEGALATEPDDRGLQSLLLASYRQQISLLERLVDLG